MFTLLYRPTRLPCGGGVFIIPLPFLLLTRFLFLLWVKLQRFYRTAVHHN